MIKYSLFWLIYSDIHKHFSSYANELYLLFLFCFLCDNYTKWKIKARLSCTLHLFVHILQGYFGNCYLCVTYTDLHLITCRFKEGQLVSSKDSLSLSPSHLSKTSCVRINKYYSPVINYVKYQRGEYKFYFIVSCFHQKRKTSTETKKTSLMRRGTKNEPIACIAFLTVFENKI